MTNLFERTVAEAKSSFRDRIRDYGSAVTVGVFIGSAITTGTLLGLGVFYISQRANLLSIARKGRLIANKINADHDSDDDDSDDDANDGAAAATVDTIAATTDGKPSTRRRLEQLEARIAALEAERQA